MHMVGRRQVAEEGRQAGRQEGGPQQALGTVGMLVGMGTLSPPSVKGRYIRRRPRAGKAGMAYMNGKTLAFRKLKQNNVYVCVCVCASCCVQCGIKGGEGMSCVQLAGGGGAGSKGEGCGHSSGECPLPASFGKQLKTSRTSQPKG